ncbi:MAG: hypothetical protein JWM76_3532 [Pseudonocardiales bacterium]|nr:hypothetical protein [Pseudonocardiales bacterium]
MTTPDPRPKRPALHSDPARLLAEDGIGQTLGRSELAAATAAALVSAGRGVDAADTGRFVELADEIGLDTLAELWRDEEPNTLPGALFAIYLMRTWCRTDAENVAHLWQAGRGLAPADEVVAGVSDDANPAALARLADAVLAGAYRGDFAVALERAAAFFRVIAEGRRALAVEGPDGEADRERAIRNDRAADGLTFAALRWRAGDLA